MQLGQQIRIKPSEAQEAVLWALSEKCRLIYNFALKERKEAFKNKIRGVNYFKQQNDLLGIKEKYLGYKWVYSKVLQYILRALDADYKSFFSLRRNGDKTARPPGYKGRKYFTTMVYNQSGFKFKNGSIELSHKHPLRTRLLFKIPEKFSFDRVYQVAVCKRGEDFYLSITYEKPEKEFKDNGLYQAFDLGVTKHMAVNIKGRFMDFGNKRPDKYWEKKIRSIQSRRDHCKKSSRKWKLLNKNLKKMKKKSANQLRDFQHKLSRKIVDNTKANTMIVGKLKVKKLSQKDKYAKGLHRSLQNTGCYFSFR